MTDRTPSDRRHRLWWTPGERMATQPADERGVSFTVSYVLTLGIAIVLITGVILAAGQVVRDQRQETITDQATVGADKVAASVMAADRLVQNGRLASATRVTVGVDLPARLAGEPYTVTLTTASVDPRVVVETEAPAVRAEVPLTNETAIDATTVTGGPVRVVLVNDRLTLEEAG